MWDLFGALVPTVTGLFFLYRSYKLGVGTLTSPGAGFWPMIISALICVLGGVLVVQQVMRPEGRQIHLKALRRPGVGLLSALVYAYTVGWLGFITTTVLLLLFWVKVIGRRSWITAFLVAIPAVVIAYGLFGYWLNVPLPAGYLM